MRLNPAVAMIQFGLGWRFSFLLIFVDMANIKCGTLRAEHRTVGSRGEGTSQQPEQQQRQQQSDDGL